MIVIFSIIAVVAAVSLYDYFVSKNWQQITSSVRNETVFEKRNKEYGAFKIRRDYDRNMVAIMGVFILGTGALFAAYEGFKKPQLTNRIVPEKRVILDDTTVLVFIKNKTDDNKQRVTRSPKDENKTASTPIVENLPPQVVDLPLDTTTVKALDDNQTAGNTNQAGTGGNFGGDNTKGKDGDGEGGDGDKNDKTDGEAVGGLDVDAQFPGGYDAMSAFIQQHLDFPQELIESGEEGGKCYLRFIVDTNGKISDVHVLRGVAGYPSCEKAAIKVIKAMPNWIPGKIKNRAVKSYFDLPINFSLK
jgi:protein TonB